MTSDVCLSVAYIGPRSRTERPRKTKIGTEVAHVTRDSDNTFKVNRSEVNLQGAGHIVAASRTACLTVIIAVTKQNLKRMLSCATLSCVGRCVEINL